MTLGSSLAHGLTKHGIHRDHDRAVNFMDSFHLSRSQSRTTQFKDITRYMEGSLIVTLSRREQGSGKHLVRELVGVCTGPANELVLSRITIPFKDSMRADAESYPYICTTHCATRIAQTLGDPSPKALARLWGRHAWAMARSRTDETYSACTKALIIWRRADDGLLESVTCIGAGVLDKHQGTYDAVRAGRIGLWVGKLLPPEGTQ